MVDLVSLFKIGVERHLKENPRQSHRGLAKKLGISPATLINYLNGKTTVSYELALHFIDWLQLSAEYKNFLSLQEELKITRSKRRQLELKSQLSFYRNGQSLLEIETVQAFLKRTKSHQFFAYLEPHTGHLRTLYFLKEKDSGNQIRSFYEIIHAPHFGRSMGAYFIENSSGLFTSYIDENLATTPRARVFDPLNYNIKIDFDHEGFPLIHNFATIETDPHVNFSVKSTFLFSSRGMQLDSALCDLSTQKSYSRKTSLVRCR